MKPEDCLGVLFSKGIFIFPAFKEVVEEKFLVDIGLFLLIMFLLD